MGDVMGPLSYPPGREGETLPPYPPPPNPTPAPARARSRGYSEPKDYGNRKKYAIAEAHTRAAVRLASPNRGKYMCDYCVYCTL